MYCNQCGSTLAEDAHFCASCGAPQPDGIAAPNAVASGQNIAHKTRSTFKWVVIVSLALVAAIGFISLVSRNSNPGQSQQGQPTTPSQSAAVSVQPDFSSLAEVKGLPTGYSGDDPELVVKWFRENLAKGAYEKTTEYNDRVRRTLSQSLIDNKSITSTFAFGIDSRQYKFPYNPDKEWWTFQMHASNWSQFNVPESLEGKMLRLPGWDYLIAKSIQSDKYTSVGTNMFGAKVDVTHKQVTNYWIAIPRAELIGVKTIHDYYVGTDYLVNLRVAPAVAAQVAPSLRVLILCRLESPYLGTESNVYEATMKDPVAREVTTYYLIVRPIELWLYNGASGEILIRSPFRTKR